MIPFQKRTNFRIVSTMFLRLLDSKGLDSLDELREAAEMYNTLYCCGADDLQEICDLISEAKAHRRKSAQKKAAKMKAKGKEE